MSGVLWYILELGMDTKIACVHSYIHNLKNSDYMHKIC